MAGTTIASRLLLGTGGIPSLDVLDRVLEAAGPTMATVAVRRVDPSTSGSILDVLQRHQVSVLPNTAGCYTASDAVLTAKLAREAFGTDWVKLEVIGDERTLLPDVVELLDAAEQLCDEGFTVLAYTVGRPGGGPTSRTARVCGRHAAGRAHRLGSGHPQSAQHRPDGRDLAASRSCSTPASGLPRRRPWPSSGLPGRAGGLGHHPGSSSRTHGGRLPPGRRSWSAGGRGRPHPPAVARPGVEPVDGYARPVRVTPAIALTIAGSDSGAGAGLQADLKTFSAHGVFGTTVVTAVTAQNTAEVKAVYRLEPAMVELQMEAVTSDMAVAAVKTGMLASSAVVRLVGRWAAAGRLPNLVVDPVLASSTGAPLLDEGAVAAYTEALVPHARVVTPNTREAALLAGGSVGDVRTVEDMKAAASALGRLGPAAVVVKGGHLDGDAVDVVWSHGAVTVLEGPRVRTGNDHGTGCTLAAALAALWARRPDLELVEALTEAKRYVTKALVGSASWHLGAGRGPLDHFGWGSGGGTRPTRRLRVSCPEQPTTASSLKRHRRHLHPGGDRRDQRPNRRPWSSASSSSSS